MPLTLSTVGTCLKKQGLGFLPYLDGCNGAMALSGSSGLCLNTPPNCRENIEFLVLR